jgi:CubicO group peptidase (beta-lactamase class C family)
MSSRTLHDPGRPENHGLSAEGLARVDAALQQKVAERAIAGAVTLVARHGEVVHTSIVGVDNVRTRKPLALDTIFRIFSMTKPVTAVAMMILHDRGLWRWDDPIAKHLPEFADLKVLVGLDRRGRPRVEEPDHAPTMGELMTHTAGFAYGVNRKDPIDRLYRAKKITESIGLDDFVSRVATLPLAHQPGSKWKYSISMDLQGAIIERLSGQRLGDFFQKHLFGPLGMIDTAFYTPPEKLDRRATLYFSGGPVRLKSVRNPLYKDATSPPELEMGGAGLVSTVMDYARFCQLLLNEGEWNGKRIVTAEGVRQMMRNHLSPELMGQRWDAGHMHFRPGFGFGYNGVVFYDPELAGIPVGVGTYMWDGAADTWFWVDPENDLLYVGLTQLLSYTAPALQEMTQKLMGDAILDRKRSVADGKTGA